MSSSTMIDGATIRRASRKRIATDSTTMPASHAHAGTAPTSARERRSTRVVVAFVKAALRRARERRPPQPPVPGARRRKGRRRVRRRSEEHTSELQSRPHLVCRLLLEKKNTNATPHLLQKHKNK